ncbi:ATP-binding cassette domain-containing protein [Arhodomonas sp. KWT2]|uniref:ATP-binding cassette domain-containing protein n=2 Tax=unclassified Arhodomonas TaxID=2621637 RepID=UPI0035C13D2D
MSPSESPRDPFPETATGETGAAHAVSPSGPPAPNVVALEGVTKAYGPTTANRDVGIVLAAGDVLGLVGANGAGKSTLMRILCGVTAPDRGSLAIAGVPVDFQRFSPRHARVQGIRIVHQELSLCTNLSVTENFFLEDARIAGGGPLWHAHYGRRARRSIDRVFPDAGIDVHARVGDLPIGQRQMVEIARAASDPSLRLLILDEPTSSLDSERSMQLRRYMEARSGEGVSFVFISHKLGEVVDIASRIAVMRNGEKVWEGDSAETSVGQLVDWMGGDAGRELESHHADAGARGRDGAAVAREPLVRIGGDHVRGTGGQTLALHAGEIVGFAGLEGSGQREMLHEVFRQARRGSVQCLGSVGFVSGDRRREGVFPLWSVEENIAVGQTGKRGPLAPLAGRGELGRIDRWLEKLRLDRERLPSPILELSGGNQQKALVARALFADADVILLDDPTRGVDVSVKRDFYDVVRELAEAGKLIIWYSSEDIEFLECDRVLVFSEAAIACELRGEDISEEAIVSSAFSEIVEEATPAAAGAGRARQGQWRQWLFRVAPFLSTMVIFAIIGSMNPMAVSAFGLDLLLGPAVPLVLVAAAQMFVVGGSHIDLGVGAFAGLVNVVSATVLVAHPGPGALALLALVAGYGSLGALIEGRKLPAIVVTLGASFIWLGIGYTLQESPGGSSPAWLSALFSWSLAGVPASVVMIAGAGVLAWAVNRSRLGVVLRGFGNNAQALSHMGWSAFTYTVARYVVAGVFGLFAGLSLTAVNTASDINASGSFTLLSVAAVVIGGCRLVGGSVTPVGVVFGALTLSLIGALLGFIGISTDYNASVQGALLIGILALRTLVGQKETAE